MYRPLFFACITSFVVGTGISMGQGDVAVRPNSLIDSVINPTSLREVVQVLASDSLEGRFTGSVHAQMAASYIANEFYKAGAAPLAGNGGYFVPFGARGKEQFGVNVMAALKGKSKPDEVIIFCAHFDHVGTQSTNPIVIPGSISKPGDSIFNGANDNATGTSAIINLARYFGQLKNNERTILFIAFSGEEQGLLGSREVALHLQPESVTAVVNIEMIGRAASKKEKKCLHHRLTSF